MCHGGRVQIISTTCTDSAGNCAHTRGWEITAYVVFAAVFLVVLALVALRYCCPQEEEEKTPNSNAQQIEFDDVMFTPGGGDDIDVDAPPRNRELSSAVGILHVVTISLYFVFSCVFE